MATDVVATSARSNGVLDTPVLELPATMSSRWALLDLDEILEGIESAGLPQRELICTYTDRRSRRRVFVRVQARARLKEAAT
jgi:hypothetical protein